MSFLGEIKRRKVFQVAAVYLVVAWLIMQVVDVVSEPLLLPGWFPRVVIVLLGIGFPLALILSWAFDLTPEGIVKDRGTGSSGGRRAEFALFGLLALAVGFILVDNYVFDDRDDSSPVAVEIDQTVPPVVAEDQQDVLPNSVAVLPFENLSADPEDAFFAAGIHEEVLNQLVKLSALNVIARTTMVRYASRGSSISEVADELNVETVMEGSVRYADGRVLVTAQLIDPETNLHLWSDSYNRELADIFEVQTDIAMNIANALEAEFSVEEQARLERIPTNSTEAWTLYLKATNRLTPVEERRSLIDAAISLDPEFALAIAQRAQSNISEFGFAEGTLAELENFLVNARQDIDRALVIDPELPKALLAESNLDRVTWRFSESESSLERALQIAPNDPRLIMTYAQRLASSDPGEAIRLGERALLLSPQDSGLRNSLGLVNLYAGEYAAGIRWVRSALDLAPNSGASHMQLIVLELLSGNHGGALEALQRLDTLEGVRGLNTRPSLGLAITARVYAALDRPDDAQIIASEVQRREAAGGIRDAVWSHVHIALGDYDLALEFFRRAIDERSAFDGAINFLYLNIFSDSVLDSDPRWIAERDRIAMSGV